MPNTSCFIHLEQGCVGLQPCHCLTGSSSSKCSKLNTNILQHCNSTAVWNTHSFTSTTSQLLCNPLTTCCSRRALTAKTIRKMCHVARHTCNNAKQMLAWLQASVGPPPPPCCTAITAVPAAWHSRQAPTTTSLALVQNT